MNPIKAMFEIRNATLEARKRTGLNLATSVQDGACRIEVVKYAANGQSTVQPLSKVVPICKAVEVLNAIQA